MKIYLGDLGHYTINLTNNHTPINLGFIAAYVSSILKDRVEFKLFKDPNRLIKAIDDDPPDILGLSNYVWCQSVSEDMLIYYKKTKKDGIGVWGGPNFPMNELHKTKDYLANRPYVDFYIPYEGETPFLKITEAALKYGTDIRELQEKHSDDFDGSFFITEDGELRGKNIGIQIPDIGTIPSPYMTGWLDEFLHEGLHPMFETQRGCPYKCTFCHTGLDYYNKGRSFTLERTIEEIQYITNTVPDPTKAHLYITDSNFGMWPQDLEFSKWLKGHYERTGFPLSFGTSTGKGRAKLVVETVMAHPKLNLTNSVQSLDDNVLKAIKRKNFKMEQLKSTQEQIDAKGKLTHPELILGLPNETRESHLDTLRKLIVDIGAHIIYQYTLMLLPGTEIYTDEMRNEHKYMVKYRILPTQFGEYAKKRCFEIEEVSVATKSLSYQDYLEMREIFFFVHNVQSNTIYRPINFYLQYLGEDYIEFFLFLMKKRKTLGDQFPNEVVQDYMNDTESELFDSKEELVEHYSKDDHYNDLLTGKTGINLTHTYRAVVFLNNIKWAEFITSSFKEFLNEKYSDSEDIMQIIDNINMHIMAQAECQLRYFNQMDNIPTKESNIKLTLDYDIEGNLSKRLDRDTHPFIPQEKVKYKYFMRDDAIQYIKTLKPGLTRVDYAVILIRMDLHYLFPTVSRESEEVLVG